MEKCAEIDINKLKIGDFVRTKNGHIGKIKGFTTQLEIKEVEDGLIDEPIPAILTDTFYYSDDENDIWEETDIKSSGKRLIDVIEHGDLVNMLLVLQVTSIMGVASSKRVKVIDGDKLVSLGDKDIRHVVCREVLEDNGYEKDV